MPLKCTSDMKFGPSNVVLSGAAIVEFHKLAIQTADSQQNVIELFKKAFGTIDRSSSYSWALKDLKTIFQENSHNAVNFICMYWRGLEFISESSITVPEEKHLNPILNNHRVPLIIENGELKSVFSSSNNPAQNLAPTLPNKQASLSNQSYTYKTVKQIGRGGYGTVYHVTKQTSAGVFEFALKELDPFPGDINYQKAYERFKREVKTISLLQHRAIVQYLDGGINKNTPFLVMPLIKGVNLRDFLSGKPIEVVIHTFCEILRGLDYAHKKGVIHRDLKPNNIIVSYSDNQPIILDFGAAYLFDMHTTSSLTTNIVGTIGYMPSEVIANPKIRSPKHDVYACGIMLYECVANQLPDPNNYKALADNFPEYAVLDAVIKRATKGVNERYQSSNEMLDALLNINIQSGNITPNTGVTFLRNNDT